MSKIYTYKRPHNLGKHVNLYLPWVFEYTFLPTLAQMQDSARMLEAYCRTCKMIIQKNRHGFLIFRDH